MKAQEFIKEVDNSDRGMNKYGLAARNKDGKFYSYRHGKLTGTFNNIQDLQRHQHELIKDESAVQEDAGLTDQQKQGLQAIAKKYKGREGYNGDFLPTGYLRANYYTSIGTDGVDGDEAEAYVKKHGYEDISDAEESDDNFWDKVEDPEHFPITSAMRTDLHKVLGDNMDNVYRQAVDYLDQLDESVSEDAGSLQNHNEELNRITKLAGLGEGASMLPYFKQDEKTWSFPDAWAKDEALDTPYMSNMSMRQFLDTLGYDSDFEQSPPVDAKEFIGRTTQWLQKNIDNPSKQIPTTVDRSGGGATMIGGGKPEGWDNRQVKHHNELARKILTKYPEVTHFGFN